MFTGLVEAIGIILAKRVDGPHLELEIELPFSQIESGESIAVEGVCLTARPLIGAVVHFDLSQETLDKTCLANLEIGQSVNLERALLVSTRMGGHYVSGHVDKTAEVFGFEPCDNYVKLCIGGFSPEDKKYLLPKGSITINGVSLTINAVLDDVIEIMLVPHTLAQTTLSNLKLRQAVNVEFDYFTRIIAHQLQHFLQEQHALKGGL